MVKLFYAHGFDDRLIAGASCKVAERTKQD
jgi:hypothetical protein